MGQDNTKTYLQKWNEIINAASPKEALIQHFTYLVDSPNYQSLLEAIMEQLDTVTIEDDCLKIQFNNNIQLDADAPEEEILEHFPLSFKEKLKHHKFLGIEEYQIILGDQGLFCESDGWHEEMDEWRNICDLNEVLSPLSEGPDLWLYHPTQTNTSGQPMLYFRPHDGGGVEKPRDINVGALFLEQLASLLDIDVHDILNPFNEEEAMGWWNGLDDAWKRFLLAEPTAEKPTVSYLKGVLKETSLHLRKESGITTLEPLRAFKELERCRLDGLPITDFSPLKDLATLKSLAVIDMPFSNFDGFAQFPQLGTLCLTNTGFSDLNKLSPLKELYSLELNNNPIKSLEGIENFRKLVRLEIDDTKVTTIAPIAGLKKLDYLHIRHLQLTDYTLLATMDNLSRIEVDGTSLGDFKALSLGIGLKKYFKFLNKIYGTNAQNIQFPTGQDVLCSGTEFVQHLNTINFPIDEYANTICLFANRLLLNAIKVKQNEVCHVLIRKMLSLKMKISNDIKQLWFGNVIVALCSDHYEDSIEQDILKTLSSMKINNPSLAFNLSCFHALRKQKPQMLKAITLALSLGKTKDSFLKDADFKEYHNDPDFIQQLK